MRLFDKIRLVNMYILIFSLLILLQKYTFGLMPGLKRVTLFDKFYLYEILFAVTALIFMKLFVKIGPPNKG